MDWTLLIGGLGIGTLATKIVDYFLAKKSSKEALLYKAKKRYILDCWMPYIRRQFHLV
jgi:hypothetical protein